MSDYLISIIVPIYNPGEYLQRCIESLVNQTKKNYEIILVDDGSTDGSGKLCKEYCKKYDNAKYFYKLNSGVSDTRNFGIERSCGEYITFVDSDDYIDENYIEKANNLIKKGYEMIIFNHALINDLEKKNVVLAEESQEITCPKFLNKYFETYCLSTACKTVYKRDMLIKNNIFFDKTINYGEDLLFSITAYLNSNKTYYLNYCAYYYISNDNSATNSVNIEKRKKHCYDNLKLYKQIARLLEDKRIEVDNNLYLDALLRNFISGLNCLWLVENAERSTTIKEILEIYSPFLERYQKKYSMLNNKTKLQLQLLKNRQYVFFSVYFYIKRKIRKLK